MFASIILGFLSITINRACERYFGGYAIGTCLIFTSLFSTTLNTAPNFLFFIGTIWTSFLMVFFLFFTGRLLGWSVPVDSPTPVPTAQANPSRRRRMVFAHSR